MENKARFFPYAKSFIDQEDKKAVSEALSSEVITRGPLVKAFEKKIAEYCGVKYAVAFTSGTTALFAASIALNISSHDTIVTSANTFIASLSMGLFRGAKPLLIDIDRKSGNLCLDDLEKNLQKKKSRGRYIVVPVHFAGQAIDMEKLESKIKGENTLIIEDAAHALGSLYPNGETVGCCSYSDMTMFSFHPAKNITTGEGGMITTNDPHLYHQLKIARDSGIEREPLYLEEEAYPGFYEVKEIACNYHMTEFQAALGMSQMNKLSFFIEERRKKVERYRKHFASLSSITLFDEKYVESTAFHIFVLQIDFPSLKISRKEVMQRLKEKGIGSQVHYIPLYRHPVYQQYAPSLEYNLSFKESEKYFEQALTLPLYVDLSLEDVDYIAKELKNILKKGSR